MPGLQGSISEGSLGQGCTLLLAILLDLVSEPSLKMHARQRVSSCGSDSKFPTSSPSLKG